MCLFFEDLEDVLRRSCLLFEELEDLLLEHLIEVVCYDLL